jgi:hypothetical protein
MLPADRVRVDAFDLGTDPNSGGIAPGEVWRLCNTEVYPPPLLESRLEVSYIALEVLWVH